MKKLEFIVLGLLLSAMFLGYEFYLYKQAELNHYKEKCERLELAVDNYFTKYQQCKNK